MSYRKQINFSDLPSSKLRSLRRRRLLMLNLRMERVLANLSKIIPAVAQIVERVMTVFDKKPEESLSNAARTDDKDKHDHILAVLKADHDRKMKEAEARLEKEFAAYQKD